MVNPIFERLEQSHIGAILEIEKLSNPAPWSEQSFSNELANPNSLFLVAKVSGKVIAYGSIWLCIDEAHITTVAVDPTERHLGYGRKLVCELLSRAKEEGMLCSTLEVRASNEAAIKLYESLGFVRTVIRKKYYPDNREDAVVMWKYDL